MLKTKKRSADHHQMSAERLFCRVYSVRMEHEGKRREGGRLVGLQFLFGAAAEVVPVEGTPKVVAVL